MSEFSFVLALLNSSVTKKLMKLITQVITLQVRDVFSIPVVADKEYKGRISQITDRCILLSKNDWDSYETSWDFERNPLV